MPLPTRYDIAETAKLLECSDKTVRRMIARGVLRAKKIAGTWQVLEEELERYLRTPDKVKKKVQ